MMNQPQIKRMLSKLTQLEATLDRYVFQKQDELSVVKYETKEQLFVHNIENLLSSEGNKWKASNIKAASPKEKTHSETGS